MESTSPLFIRVNEENTAVDSLFDAWREITSPLFDTTVQTRSTTYAVEVAACMAGEVFASRVIYDPMVCQRGRRHLTHGDMDYYVLQLFIAGSEQLFTGDSRYLLAPNTVCLRDWRYGYTGISQRNDIIGLAIPRHLLNTYGCINAKRPVLLWPIGSVPGKLLAKTIMRTWQQLPHASAQEAAMLADNLLGLLNGILVNRLMGQSEELRINHAMLLGIKQYIADHLDDPALGVERLCHTFHLSRASLYRLFKEEGGLQRYVREQRLTRCLNLLTDAYSPGVKVREVAERWGFDNPSHFHRLFKGNFGIAPSDLRMQAVDKPRPTIREALAIQNWARGGSLIKSH